MIPVHQTIMHDPANGKNGNCLSAVIASLLHIPIEEIPVFYAPHPEWQRKLNAWLKPYGLAYIQLGMFDEYCAEIGITGCHHEIGGPTSRSDDVLHACVAVDGQFVFDPMPNGKGLTEIQSSGVFIALEPWKMLDREKQPE